MGKLLCKTSAGYTPSQPPNFLTTYREEGLVGKLSSTSPPPIQKRGSWGSSQTSAGYTPSQPPNFPTTYTEEGVVRKRTAVR